MQQKVQRRKKESKRNMQQQQEGQPCLCDGCDNLISEKGYIQHWEKCILIKKMKRKQEKYNQKKLEQKEKKKKDKEKKEKKEKKKKKQKDKERQNEKIQKKQQKVQKLVQKQEKKQEMKQQMTAKKTQTIKKQQTIRKQPKKQQNSDTKPKVSQFTNCKKCGNKIPSDKHNIEAHKQVCMQRQESCQYCQTMVVNYLMKDHLETCQMKQAIELSSKQTTNSNRQVTNQRNQHPPPQRPPNQPLLQMDPTLLALLQNPNEISRLISEGRLSLEQIQALQQLGLNIPLVNINPRNQQSRDRDLDLLEEFFKPTNKLTEEQFRNFKRIKYVSSCKDDSCSICQTNYEKAEEVIILECEHIFHPNCLSQWLLKRGTKCPNCQKELKGKK